MTTRRYSCRWLHHGSNQVDFPNQGNWQWEGPVIDAEGNISGWGTEPTNEQICNIPVIYHNDEVAQIYQHSK